MAKRYCTRSAWGAQRRAHWRRPHSLTFLLVLRDIRHLGTLLQQARSIDSAWSLLNKVSLSLELSKLSNANGRGSIQQSTVFASSRALNLILNNHRDTVSKDTSTIRIRGESVRDFRVKICVAIQGKFACDGDGPPLFAHYSQVFAHYSQFYSQVTCII